MDCYWKVFVDGLEADRAGLAGPAAMVDDGLVEAVLTEDALAGQNVHPIRAID